MEDVQHNMINPKKADRNLDSFDRAENQRDVQHFQSQLKRLNLELQNAKLKYEDSEHIILGLKRELKAKEEKAFRIEENSLRKENELLSLKQR